MYTKEEVKHVWTDEDEKEHPASPMEWWCFEVFVESEDKKKFSAKYDLTEWEYKDQQKKGSLYKISFFDLDDNKVYHFKQRSEKERLESAKNEFYVKRNDSYMKGSYPNFEFFFNDPDNKIQFKGKFTAESYPHWIAQDITNGWLPLGFGGAYRYGFIPKGEIQGKILYKDKAINIKGTGYFEHVWGEFTYHKIFGSYRQIKKTLNIYFKLINEWKKNYKIKIPEKIKLSSENNPFGYDWFWAVFDNGWSTFFGNIMIFLMEGPTAGPLILTKDGKNYTEFYKTSFRYMKIESSQEYDFIYPTEIEIKAEKGEEKIYLRLKTLSDSRKHPPLFSSIFSDSKIWRGFAICEIPGLIEGYYENGKEKINLSGFCKFEPQRQMSVLGHNQIEINILKPPKGVGIKIDLDSHFLKKQFIFNINLLPKLKLKINVKKL